MTVFEKEDKVAAPVRPQLRRDPLRDLLHARLAQGQAVPARRGTVARVHCRPRIEYREIGKVIVARDEVEVARLRDLQQRAAANGVPGVTWSTGRPARARTARARPGGAALPHHGDHRLPAVAGRWPRTW